MATLIQENLPLTVATPLGGDALILTGISIQEELSRLFEIEMDLLALSSTTVDFGDLLGQTVTASMSLPEGGQRHYSGIVKRVLQGGSSTGPEGVPFVAYRAEVVPHAWLLTRRFQSRIFQNLSVPEILEAVLDGLDVGYEIQGTYHPRTICVQYRESDFAFASRLMEEEGIYYFFKHDRGQHKLLLADTPASHPDLPVRSTLAFEPISGGLREESRIQSWEKQQELRSGKYTLWDHNFELPQSNLEASAPTLDSVSVGTVTHKLKVGGNEALEIYDYPGEYAQRFDGVAPGGGDQSSDLQKIYEDNVRTTKLRMQQEESGSVWLTGSSNCRQMTAGHKFKLEKHPNANGSYVVVSVRHRATMSQSQRSGGDADFSYENEFVCIPENLPFRPARSTPRPRVAGCQTATVVGPAGEEIFTDKYGRVKVQFHWDREGSNNDTSSCWVRVASTWAGKQWGAIHIPRIGQEVLVDFMEGDPDRPIIVGSVYNADHMPPYELPANKTQSGIKSRSTLSGKAENFNEIRFEDKKGQEQVYIHAEKNLDTVVENNETRKVGFEKKDKGDQEIEVFNDRSVHVGAGKGDAADGSDYLTIYKDHVITVEEGDQTVEVVTGDQTIRVTEGKQTISVEGDRTIDVKTGHHLTTVDTGNDKLRIKQGNQEIAVDMGNQTTTIKMGNKSVKVNLGKSTEEAMQSIELKVGANSIKVDQTGVTIKGMMVKIEADVMVQIKGSAMAQVEGGGILTLKGGVTMIN